MESYIVRIYRREPGDAVVGVAEDALSRRSITFKSIAELSDWLRHPPIASRRGRARQLHSSGDEPS